MNVLDLFAANDADDLTGEFRDFISSKHRDVFDQIVEERKMIQRPSLEVDVDDPQDVPRTTTEVLGNKRPLPTDSTIPDMSLPGAIPLSNRPQCPICHEEATNAYSAKCGHTCCFPCWNSWLQSRLECPICKMRTRIPQLKKAYLA